VSHGAQFSLGKFDVTPNFFSSELVAWDAGAQRAGKSRCQHPLEQWSAECGKILTASSFKTAPSCWEIWTAYNTQFLCSHTPNQFKIDAAIFAGITSGINTQTDRAHYVCSCTPHLTSSAMLPNSNSTGVFLLPS